MDSRVDPVAGGASEDVAAPAGSPPAARARPAGRRAPFEVHLEVFTGPFDLLLQLISKHRLDVTEVALAAVTDEFVAHLRARSGEAAGAGVGGEEAQGPDGAEEEEWDLGQASEFLVVAATLLDLKAARLLPSGEVEDAEDLALLEARDLLFARLLQYRAYKDVSAVLADRLARFGRSVPRSAPLEPALAGLLPELVLSTTPEQLAELAAAASRPRPAPPGVGLAHLHGSAVSVREEALAVARHLRREGSATFRELVRDAGSVLVVVARFLALLELFRDGAVALEQADALAELSVRWTRPARDGEDEDEALEGVVRGVVEPGEDAPS
ncbi:ScpA family protein [uncultured Pseudokineococcus sp.]|uniref:segregation and condensation protein A n=1 Tax=uncultured Pseudokineococcus sp. TaxID=1642928 RepID=UPI00260EC93A|nr:ScpA family protein [uncultured Pseudokineococcus sp.]